MASTLDYDRSGLTSAAVGERGVSDDALNALAPDLERARTAKAQHTPQDVVGKRRDGHRAAPRQEPELVAVFRV